MTDFSVSEQTADSAGTVLDVVGELDLAAAPEMRAAGLGALETPGCSLLVLDVAKLTFIDSTGLGSWVELSNHAHQHDQRLELRGVSENITRILGIAGLTSLFDLDGRASVDNET